MKNITVENIARVTGGQLHIGKGLSLEREATGVVVDSRLIKDGGVFVATKGARVDGHDFIPQVMEKGALCVVCEERPKSEDYTYVLVEDSFTALKQIAKFYRSNLDVKIVGIIGSVGKTSTKELVASVLETKYRTLKTDGNFNNEVGVPLTICRICEEHEVAVVEMGISDFGEMSRLADIVRPDAVVMTNIGPCHLEKLMDLDGVLKAKTEVFEYMDDGAILVLNNQDSKLSKIKKSGNKKIVYYGAGSDVYASEVVSRGLVGTDFTLNLHGERIVSRVNIPGEHMVLNSLAAAAIANEWGIAAENIAVGIANAKTVSGRCNIMEANGYIIVDDCYNANPKSMRASIDMMTDATGRKVAILGDMFELGENEKNLHAQIGEYAVEKGIDVLICIGELSRNMYDAAKSSSEKTESNMILEYYEKKEELLDLIEAGRSVIHNGDTILIKASHGMSFEKIVECLKK